MSTKINIKVTSSVNVTLLYTSRGFHNQALVRVVLNYMYTGKTSAQIKALP